MDPKFTVLLRIWLETPSAERDYAVGALYLLRLSGNQIMYRNLVANPQSKAEFIEYQLQKYYNFRVAELTHEEVVEMQRQVEDIVARNISLAANADANKVGRRPDHDDLPEEIQQLLHENMKMIEEMRQLHATLRGLSLADSPCPDSERYPFLKRLIELDKKVHANWERYDHYVVTK